MKQVMIPQSNEESVRTILDIISDGIWDWNANTGYVYRSPAWYTMLGYEVHTLDNDVFTWESVIHEDDFERVMQHFDAYTTQKSKHYQIEYRCKCKSGDYIWVEDRAKIVDWNDDGTVARMIGCHRNINDKKIMQDQLSSKTKTLEALVEERTQQLIKVNAELELKVEEVQRLAETDSLTQIANRYHFEKVLQREVERAKRFKETLSIIAMDIDDFKNVNDQFGHSTGDLTLIHIAKVVTENIRDIDLVARWGGDEFMIILPNTPLKSAIITAEKILEKIASRQVNDKVVVTVSFGIAELRESESSMRLTVRADNALYQSKYTGKNTINY